MSVSETRASAALIGGIVLLERALNYTLGSLRIVTPAAMSQPTCCQGWDLRALLAHLNDSLVALDEAVGLGQVPLRGSGDLIDPDDDPVGSLRSRACRLLGAWVATDGDHPVLVAGLPLSAEIVAGTGAVEVAVHGWDVAQACGWRRPIPPSLAAELLDLLPLLVTEADRPSRFAAPVRVHPWAGPGDRLLAYLGRDPDQHPS